MTSDTVSHSGSLSSDTTGDASSTQDAIANSTPQVTDGISVATADFSGANTQTSPTLSGFTTSPSSDSSSPDSQTQVNGSSNLASKGSNKGAIAGGVIGGLILLLILGLGTLWFIRKRRRSRIPASAQFREIGTQDAAPGPYMNSYSSRDPLHADMTAISPEDEHPPSFYRGSFAGTLYEKGYHGRKSGKDFGVAI